MSESDETIEFMPLVAEKFMEKTKCTVDYRIDNINSRGEEIIRNIIVNIALYDDDESLEAKARSFIQYVLYLNTERSKPDLEAITQEIELDLLRTVH